MGVEGGAVAAVVSTHPQFRLQEQEQELASPPTKQVCNPLQNDYYPCYFMLYIYLIFRQKLAKFFEKKSVSSSKCT